MRYNNCFKPLAVQHSKLWKGYPAPGERRETQKDESLSQYYEDLGNSGSWPDTSTVQHIRNGSLDDFGNGSAVVVLGGNTGVSALLFDNPRYRPRLMELGMRPENAWRCSMNYMFAPNAEVQEYWKHEFEVMSSDMFKVGIQMRLGDYFLAGPNPGRSRHHRNAEPVLASVQHFLDCAEQLEATYKLPGQEAVWFVISDSVDLRRLALEKYGSKVMTRVMQPSHILAASESEKRNTMFETVGEHWLFGMADYNVVSHMGSFGKTGALRKHSWHNIYRLNIQQVPEPGTVICDGYHTLPLDYGEIARWPPFI